MQRLTLVLLLAVCFTHVTTAQKTNPILVPFKSGALWGYADTTGTVKIPAVYDKVDFCLYYGQCQVYKDGLTGFHDTDGSTIVPIVYEACEPLDKYVVVKKGGEWGLIDWSGSIVVPLVFDSVRWLSEKYSDNNFLLVEKNGAKGVLKIVGKDAETLIPISFAKIDHQYYDRQFRCEDNNGNVTGYNENGEVIPIDPREIEYGDVLEEPVSGSDDIERYSFIRKNGKRLMVVSTKNHLRDTIAVPYDSIIPVRSNWGFLLVKSKNQWGVINDKGTVLLQPQFQAVDVEKSWIDSDLPIYIFCAKKKNKWGIVRIQKSSTTMEKLVESKVVIPFEYDSFQKYGYEYLIAKKQNLYGVISRLKLKIVVPVKYEKISPNWVYNDSRFDVFMVKDDEMENVYVGQNGVEFYK